MLLVRPANDWWWRCCGPIICRAGTGIYRRKDNDKLRRQFNLSASQLLNWSPVDAGDEIGLHRTTGDNERLIQQSWKFERIEKNKIISRLDVILFFYPFKFFAPLWRKVSGADGLTGCAVVRRQCQCRTAMCDVQQDNTTKYFNRFFSVRLTLILMKLGMNATSANGYIATHRILNIRINYAN